MRAFFDKVSMIVISIIIILNMGTVYIVNNYFHITIISLLIIVVIAMFCFPSTIKTKQNTIALSILYALIFIPFALMSKSGSGILLFCGFIPSFFLIGFYFYKKGMVKDFLLIYIHILLIIGVVSLFFWVLMSCLHIIKPSGFIILQWGGIEQLVPTYHNIYFESQNYILNLFGINIRVRNCGIFSEAPMASFVYSSALLANCYLSNNKRNVIEALLALLIISTLSTTGLIIIICYYSLIFCLRKSKSKITRILKSLVILVIVIIVILCIRYLVIDKLNSVSGSVRSNKIALEFDAFLQNPLIGHGFNTYMDGSSNSFTSILADGGIVLFVFYYVPIFIEMFKHRKNKVYFMILILYCAMFIITSVAYSYLNTIFIVELWCDIFNLRKKIVLNNTFTNLQCTESS